MKKTHELFLIVLSKLRTNNRFCRDKPTIEFLAELLNEILNTAQKNNDFNNAKNCVILSQTFYYEDASQPKKKIYLIEYIKKHTWLKSKEFWNDFILTMILREFKKLEEMDEQKKLNVLKNQNITDKVKVKLREILFSQLLPYIGNMNEFQIDKKYIIKVVDNISSTFNYMDKSCIESIHTLVCEKKEELEKIKKEMKNDKSLADFTLNKTIIKNASKTSEDEDEEDENQE